jgi:hypothetical protein
MTSHNCKRENVFMLEFCIEINIPFTGLLFHISSASIYSLSPSEHISSLTLISDSLHIFEDKKIYFYKKNWSVQSPFLLEMLCMYRLSQYILLYLLSSSSTAHLLV